MTFGAKKLLFDNNCSLFSDVKEELKQSVIVTGRAIDVLTNVAGIPREILNKKKNFPCPKCGGTDRFRLLDPENGAVFCNQCFNKGNGDFFSAIQWMKSVSFVEAVQLTEEYINSGILSSRIKKHSDTPFNKIHTNNQTHSDKKNSLNNQTVSDNKKYNTKKESQNYQMQTENQIQAKNQNKTKLKDRINQKSIVVTERKTYVYKNESGQDMYTVERVRYSDGKKIVFPQRCTKKGRISGLGGLSRIPILYNLPDLVRSDVNKIIFVEGEKCADAVKSILPEQSDWAVTTISGGCASWAYLGQYNYFQYLKEKIIYLLPDDDICGTEAAKAAILALRNAGHLLDEIKMYQFLPPPDKQRGTGYDVADWIEEHCNYLSNNELSQEFLSCLKSAQTFSEQAFLDEKEKMKESENNNNNNDNETESGFVPIDYYPFPIDALPPSLKTIAEDFQEGRKMDPAFIAPFLLGACAGIIGNTSVVQLNKEDWEEPSIL